MSSREPLWYCHQCHAEMRPLMIPDPACASCRGSFVEKMEDPNNDPRDFTHPGHGGEELEGIPPGIDTFLLSLQTMMDRGQPAMRQRPSPTSSDNLENRSATRPGSWPNISVRSNNGPSDHIPTMSEFIQRGPDRTGNVGTITGPMMAQYLMALLGQRDPFNEFLGRGTGSTIPGMEGRMGDYVFNQEALDQIITQLMENSNAHRPVPATEEIVANLPREVLEHGSPLLEKDCAVCKEQFKLETEDPDEQVVVTLPCKHPFHEPCILPWLKSSGTCPVCRHALIPQPEHHHPTRSTSPSSSAHHNHSSNNSPGNHPPRLDPGRESPGIFQTLFEGLVGGGHNNASSSRHTRSNPDSPERPRGGGNRHLPGSWNEDLD